MTEVDNTDVRPDQDAEAWLSRSVRLLIVSHLLVMLTKSCSKCKVKCNRCYLWLESQGKFMEISYCLQHVSCSKNKQISHSSEAAFSSRVSYHKWNYVQNIYHQLHQRNALGNELSL
jgi:hypothetical protein